LGPELDRASHAKDPQRHQTLRTAKASERAPTQYGLDLGRRLPCSILTPAAVLALQRIAGNSSVASVLEQKPTLQRDIGWEGASKEGHAWNAKGGRQEVGGILRLPLDGLAVGLQSKTATAYKPDPTDPTKWIPYTEGTAVPGLSPESATGKADTGRAIVLLPQSLTADDAFSDKQGTIDVVIFLHGHTEGTNRPFAGWRALSTKAPKNKYRQGMYKEDEPGNPPVRDTSDTAPVRDVALDQAEQQLEASGEQRTIMILPQGGLHSQFGKGGDYSFNSTDFVGKIIERLKAEGKLKTTKGSQDIVRTVSMAGHSGAGTTLSAMAAASVDQMKAGKPPPLTGDLVLFDAINGDSQLGHFEDWAKMRLDADLLALKNNPAGKRITYLQNAPKLRGYYSTGEDNGGYERRYVDLQNTIKLWFSQHAAELAPLDVAGCLYENFFVLNPIPVSHEELMRGVKADQSRNEAGPGGGDAGTILDALHALHPQFKTCQALPDLTVPDATKQPSKHRAREGAHKGAAEEEKTPSAVGH